MLVANAVNKGSLREKPQTVVRSVVIDGVP